MSRLGHGGDVERALQELGLSRQQVYDFSASINPLGLPESVRSAICGAVERVIDYPEIDARSLRQAVALYHQLPQENLLPGSGSTELIYLLPQALRPRRALLVEPAFSEYAPALRQSGCQVDTFVLDPAADFQLDPEDLLRQRHPDTDMVWLANPGNPSGAGIAPDLLIGLAERLDPCRLVIDEAFVDFCPKHSLIGRVEELGNLLILRSLTKFYAIPGLRAGYLAGPAEDVARVAGLRPPWSLSSLAIAAARACLGDESYRKATLAEIPRLRASLQEGLGDLALRVFPSVANYLLVQTPADLPDADILCDRLRGRGILLRSCANFYPLDQRFLRLAVRNETENSHLLEALAEEIG